LYAFIEDTCSSTVLYSAAAAAVLGRSDWALVAVVFVFVVFEYLIYGAGFSGLGAWKI